MVNVDDIRPGAWVKAPSFLDDGDPEQTRSLRVQRVYEHNGRPAFDALVAHREGDAPVGPGERMVWRYAHQVTRIVRPAPRPISSTP